MFFQVLWLTALNTEQHDEETVVGRMKMSVMMSLPNHFRNGFIFVCSWGNLAVTIRCSIVGSRLDYCNSLLYGAPSMSLDRLQRCQDTLARVVTQSSSRTSAKPLLQSLHWLPVR